MKKIIAIIKPFKLDDGKEALQHINIQGLTISEIKGFSPPQGDSEIYPGAEYIVDFIPKLKVELMVDDARVPQILKTIQESIRTGKIGDGQILVFPVEEVIRIRTGETGLEAV